ncbi:MAG: hypothetical protein AAB797_03125 [Patescibacteria group bacterium]
MEEKKRVFNSLRRTIYFLSFLAAFFIFTGVTANAASLYFSPNSGKFGVADTFTVSVYVNTQDEAINNAEATINFPTDLLSAISASQAGSIFSLWVQPVTISNSDGSVTFNGGVPTPGYKGASGKILSAVFKVKKSGKASLTFSSASVRANDGKGTDILTSAGTAQFTLGEILPTTPVEPKPAPTAPPVKSNTPAAPEISSPTHPDPTKWYSANDIALAWPLPSGITQTRVLLGQIPVVVPTVTYTSPISSKEIEEIEDGQWYFHAQLRNANGWGQVSHFPIKIDTQKPNLEVNEVPREDITYPKVKFSLTASDAMSGIDQFEVQIDNAQSQTWNDDGSHVYETSALDPGRHTLIVKVFDKAGNSVVDSLEFNISAINPPEITDYPKDLTVGQMLFVKGLSYPNADVTVWFQKDKEEPVKQEVKTDKDGVFSTIFEEKVEEGIYSIWAEVQARGAKSGPSDKITIGVRQPTFLRIGSWLVSFLAVVITLISLILLLLLILWYAWYKYRQFKIKIQKDIKQVEQTIHKEFDMLRENVRKQIAVLEKVKFKRDLTKEEEKILVQLKKQLNSAEDYIRKEMEKIEKEI